jgi:hypothetical protein
LLHLQGLRSLTDQLCNCPPSVADAPAARAPRWCTDESAKRKQLLLSSAEDERLPANAAKQQLIDVVPIAKHEIAPSRKCG